MSNIQEHRNMSLNKSKIQSDDRLIQLNQSLIPQNKLQYNQQIQFNSLNIQSTLNQPCRLRIDQQGNKDENNENDINLKQNHKLIVIALLGMLFLAYRFAYNSWLTQGQCIRDVTHQLTEKINQKLNQDGDFAYYFIIAGQFFVDFQMMTFIIFQMFKVENFFPSVWIALFYGIRGIFLNIEKFPYPPNVYWDQPGFPPSIGVPYGITSDYFYSGHTGIMLFSYLYWKEKGEWFLQYIALIGWPYIMLLVLSSRVHYLSDVVAAIFFSLWIYRFVQGNLVYFDKFFTKIYLLLLVLLNWIDNFLIFLLRFKRGNKKNNQNKMIEQNDNVERQTII